MKYKNVKIMTKILLLFFFVQMFGLYVGSNYLVSDLPYDIEQPESMGIHSVTYLVTFIFLATFVFFLLMKFNLKKIFLIWMFLAFVIAMSISLSSLINSSIALFVATVLFVIGYYEEDDVVKDITSLLLFPGIAVLFAPMFTVYTFFILLGVIAIYDFISVYITKHMITLAKSQSKLKMFPGIIVRDKNEVAVLGGGDIIFPMILGVIVLRDVSLSLALVTAVLATLSVLTLLLIGKKKEYYPAMPVVATFLLPILFLI